MTLNDRHTENAIRKKRVMSINISENYCMSYFLTYDNAYTFIRNRYDSPGIRQCMCRGRPRNLWRDRHRNILCRRGP